MQIHFSPTLREDLKKYCMAVKIEPKQMIRPVSTRWNSVAEAMERAIYLQPALDKLVDAPHHNTWKSMRLAKYKLKESEWEVLKQLQPILQVCFYCNLWNILTDYILAFSKSHREGFTVGHTTCA